MAVQKTGNKLDPESDGLYLDNNKIVGCNGNIFARTILERFKLILTSGDRFYLYRDGVYQFQEPILLSRRLRKFLHRYEADCWTEGIERTYIAGLKREATYVKQMDSRRNFLNAMNCMVGLKSFKTYPHDPKYRSTIQLPIEYDPSAKCPNFIAML